MLTSHQYCLDFRTDQQTKAYDLVLAICFDTDPELEYQLVEHVRLIIPIGTVVINAFPSGRNELHWLFFLCLGMLISVVFIIATLIVYGWIPKLRNLNGKCLMNYLTMLAIGYALMAWTQTNSLYKDQALLCFSIGYTVYFTFCSAFSWLTVINYDFWLNSKQMAMKTAQENSDYMSPMMIW